MKLDDLKNNFVVNSALLPAKFIAITTALVASVALLFILEDIATYVFEIYVARLVLMVVAFTILVLLNQNTGREHVFKLLHALLFTVAATSAFIAFRDPDKFSGNIFFITFILLIAGLSAGWSFKNQLAAVCYSIFFFLVAIALNQDLEANLNSYVQTVSIFILLSLCSIIASYFLNRERESTESEILNGIDHSDKDFQDVESNIYEEIIDSLPEGIFRTGTDGKILFANEALAKILGYDDVLDFSKVNANELYIDGDERKKLLKVLLAQKRVKNYRVRLVKKDGTPIVARVSERIVNDEEDNPLFIEGLVQDISQQVKIEEERKQEIHDLKTHKRKSIKEVNTAVYTSNIKAQFLASMSHEIKTPINSIVGFLTLIEKGMFESEAELKDFAGNAKTAADALLDIINNMLDISKIEAGKMQLEDSEFNIFDEVEKAKSIITPLAQNKNLSVKFETDPMIPKVLYGDPTRYRQIAVNILNNSVKYTDEGTIHFSLKLLKATQATVILKTSIIDTGRGIPKEKLGLIFKPYTQVKQKKWTTKDGAGLGLMISNEFVRLMGGEINLDSEEGIGTTVEFTTVMKTTRDFLMKDDKEKLAQSAEQDERKDETAAVFEETEQLVSTESDESANDIVTTSEQFKTDFRRDETEEQVSSEVVTSNSVQSGNRKRLLLVEDNPISQKVEKKLLTDSGYEVEAVSSALDAIEAIKTSSFDLVLMDVEMPDMDGLTATQKIRQLDPPVNEVPIIAVTAHSSMKDREKCLASGMNDYIAKPININFMRMTIDQWLLREE